MIDRSIVKRELSQRAKVMSIRRMLRNQPDKQRIPNEVIVPTRGLSCVQLDAGSSRG